MLTVHHLGLSQSERIVWLCEELEIPYRLELYARDPQTRLAPPAYKALHPMEIAPVITDGDLVLAESGAIMDYILAKYGDGRLKPSPDDPAFADYLFWFHFANGTVMPSEMGAGMAKSEDAPPMARLFKVRAELAFALIERRLGEVPYLAGADFTAADIMMGFPLTTMRLFSHRDFRSQPNIRAYLARIGERPAYRRALAKGDPDRPPLGD